MLWTSVRSTSTGGLPRSTWMARLSGGSLQVGQPSPFQLPGLQSWILRVGDSQCSSDPSISAGGDVMLANQNDMLVEYKISLQSPYGVVCLNTAGRSIRMVDSAGKEVIANLPCCFACRF